MNDTDPSSSQSKAKPYHYRVLHLDTGRSIHHLTLDSAFLPKKKIQENGGVEDDDSTIVWQVLVLADGTLVTGMI